MPDPDPWLDVAGAARLIECSESMVRKLCRQRRLTHQRIGTRYRFRRAWVEAYVRATTAGPAATAAGGKPDA